MAGDNSSDMQSYCSEYYNQILWFILMKKHYRKLHKVIIWGETFYCEKFQENIIIESVEPCHVEDASVDEYFVFVKWYSLYAREFMFIEISEFNLKRA